MPRARMSRAAQGVHRLSHNAFHKDRLGWLDGRVQTATTSGTYNLGVFENADATVNALKVPRGRDSAGAVNSYYYLEYRKPTTNWNGYLTGRPEFTNGVLLHMSGYVPPCTSNCNPDYSGDGGGGAPWRRPGSWPPRTRR